MFKKTILAALAYLLIGGVISGLSLGFAAKECGEKINHVEGYAELTLLWPAALATGMALSAMGAEVETTCKTTK